MRKIETVVYQYNELPSETAKLKALDWAARVSLDHEWWEYVYEDAKGVQFRLQAFDLDRQTISGDFFQGGIDTARLILKEHGDMTSTYEAAQNYVRNYEALEKDEYGEWVDETAADNLRSQFKHQLLASYFGILKCEYDHLQSRQVLEELIEANGYEFDENGNRAG